MRDKESFNAVYRSLNAYVSETARFEEAFADIRHYLQELTKAERETIIRDDLWQYALKTDYESGALSGDVRNVATALIVRLWAAMGPADELGVYLFDYIKRTDETWHDFWAKKVLRQ